jgi:hypothetical protein
MRSSITLGGGGGYGSGAAARAPQPPQRAQTEREARRSSVGWQNGGVAGGAYRGGAPQRRTSIVWQDGT